MRKPLPLIAALIAALVFAIPAAATHESFLYDPPAETGTVSYDAPPVQVCVNTGGGNQTVTVGGDTITVSKTARQICTTYNAAPVNVPYTHDPAPRNVAIPHEEPPPPPPSDTTPPAKPVLSLGAVTQTSMTLNWQAGTDNVGVDHYNVFLNGQKLAETNELTWTYTGLTCGTSYAQGLTVEDAAGNTSNLGEATWTRSTLACDNPPPPPSGGFPDASNTGPTGTLVESTGNVTVNTAGAVIENRRINGCVVVNAPNVTIRNSEIRCGGSSVIWSGSTGLVVEDTLIECGHTAGTTGLTPQNYTARRSELFGCENILWAESDVLLEDNYIHDPIPCCGAGDPHTDSVQVPGGASNITLRHNTIFGGYINQSNFGNSAITAAETSSISGTMLVTGNLLAGGGATLRCPMAGGGFSWTNNRFSTIYVSTVGGFGPLGGFCGSHPHSGNVIHETGEPVG